MVRNVILRPFKVMPGEVHLAVWSVGVPEIWHPEVKIGRVYRTQFTVDSTHGTDKEYLLSQFSIYNI